MGIGCKSDMDATTLCSSDALVSSVRVTTQDSGAAANSCVAACHPPTQVPRVRIPTVSVGRSAKRWEG